MPNAREQRLALREIDNSVQGLGIWKRAAKLVVLGDVTLMLAAVAATLLHIAFLFGVCLVVSGVGVFAMIPVGIGLVSAHKDVRLAREAWEDLTADDAPDPSTLPLMNRPITQKDINEVTDAVNKEVQTYLEGLRVPVVQPKDLRGLWKTFNEVSKEELWLIKAPTKKLEFDIAVVDVRRPYLITSHDAR